MLTSIRRACMLICVWLFTTLRTIARQAPLSMGFPRQECWNGLPSPSPENLLNPGTEPKSPVSPALQADSFIIEPPGKPTVITSTSHKSNGNWRSLDSSVIQSCPTLCDPMDCSTPGFPVLHHLQELAQPHVHCISNAIQPSLPLSSPSPPAFNLSRPQDLF